MKANNRSVSAIRKAGCGNHRITIPHATRPGQGREKGDDGRQSCQPVLPVPFRGRDQGISNSTRSPLRRNISKSASRVTHVHPFSNATAACWASATIFPAAPESQQK